MINIAMKSKGPVKQASLLSINQARKQDSLTAQTISALNRPAQYYTQQAVPSTTRPAQADIQPVIRRPGPSGTQADSRTPLQPSTHTNGRTPLQSATHTNGRTPLQPDMHTNGRTSLQPDAQTAAGRPVQSRTASPAVPVRRKLPPLTKPVQKGQKIPLPADAAAPGLLKVCFGWNTSDPRCDADVSAFLLGADGKVIGDSWFIFYGQVKSPDGSCRLDINQATDREVITIDFQKLNPNVQKIVFVLTINEAFSQRLHFGMMQDAYIRILDGFGKECVSYRMTEYYSNVISMMIGEIYQYKGSWKFHAVGNGVARDLAGLCALYGVEVSD